MFPLTNTTSTAAYLEPSQQVANGGRARVTYAAVAAEISARFAFVIIPILKAKAAVKTATMPSFAASEVTQYKPTMEPIKRTAATTILMTATVVAMAVSLNRPIRWRPSRESSGCSYVS